MNASSGSGLWPIRIVCIRGSVSVRPQRLPQGERERRIPSRADRVRALPAPRARVGRDDLIEAVARRDGVAALLGLAALTLLAWLYLSRLGQEMAMDMAPAGPWSATDALLAAGVWAVMMVAMLRRCAGLRHGLFCLGCCWALMALLFVGGVMNLAWVAAIAGFVLVEKLVPAGRVVSWLSGGALLAWGVWTLYSVL